MTVAVYGAVKWRLGQRWIPSLSVSGDGERKLLDRSTWQPNECSLGLVFLGWADIKA